MRKKGPKCGMKYGGTDEYTPTDRDLIFGPLDGPDVESSHVLNGVLVLHIQIYTWDNHYKRQCVHHHSWSRCAIEIGNCLCCDLVLHIEDKMDWLSCST